MLFGKTKYVSSASLSVLAWRKFRKNKQGFYSLVFVLITIIIALLGYLITPDSTPSANDQHLELALKKPGFAVEMIPVKKEAEQSSTSLFAKMLWGAKNNVTWKIGRAHV